MSGRCFSVSVPEDDFDDEDTTSDCDDVVERGMLPPPQPRLCTPVPPPGAHRYRQTIDLTIVEDELRLTEKGGAVYSRSGATARNTVGSDVIDLTSEPEKEDAPKTSRRQSTPFPDAERSVGLLEEVLGASVPGTFPKPSPVTPMDTMAQNTVFDVPPVLARDVVPELSPRNSTTTNSEPPICPFPDVSSHLPMTQSSSSPGPISPSAYHPGDVSVAMSSDDEVDMSDDSAGISQDSDAETDYSARSDLGDGNMRTEFDEDEGEYPSAGKLYEIPGVLIYILDLGIVHYDSSSESNPNEQDDSSSEDGGNLDISAVSSACPSPVASSPAQSHSTDLSSKLPDDTTPLLKQPTKDCSYTHTRNDTVVPEMVHNRLPSPSDAAMVKTTSFFKSKAGPTYRDLGEKTGKHEFFAAREDNKAAFAHPLNPPKVIAAQETLAYYKRILHGDTSLPPAAVTGSSVKASTTKPDESYCIWDAHLDPKAFRVDSELARSGERFINSPDQVTPARLTLHTRVPTPDLDMSSAYTFHQSKLNHNSKADPNIKRVPIQDLLANEPTAASVASSPAGCKRAFDEAFSDSEATSGDEDFQPNTDSDISDIGTGFNFNAGNSQSNQEASDLVNPEQSSVSSAGQDPTPVPVSNTSSPPAKRRRIAEVAACVAVGGLGVLSALIMSAPSF